MGFELDAIKSILADEDIEAYVAVEHFDPAKDVFCSKICTKIIESKMCVVLLTSVREPKGVTLPNPNVCYEYGLMTAWGKPVIPVQREGDELVFNIRSRDTVKYSPNNFRERFHRALRIVLSKIEDEIEADIEHPSLQEHLDYYMELKDHSRMKGTVWIVQGLPFIPYRQWKFGIIVTGTETAERLFFSTKLLYRRLERYAAKLEKEMENLTEECSVFFENGDKLSDLSKLLEGKKTEIKRLQSTEIFIVDSSGMNLAGDILERLRKIESTLVTSIKVLSPHEIRTELGLG